MSITVNSFPAGHALHSSRGWILALIALIHLGFFWLLTTGMGKSIVAAVLPSTTAVIIEPERRPPPPPTRPTEPTVASQVFTPVIPVPTTVEVANDTAPLVVSSDPVPLQPLIAEKPARPVPVEVAPQIDPRRGLSEPEYPPALIRQGVEGLVILSVQVLENGRVGDVRIEQSSGYAKLDESAMREAKQWRLIPGKRDGVPVVLWKQIPIRFRLEK